MSRLLALLWSAQLASGHLVPPRSLFLQEKSKLKSPARCPSDDFVASVPLPSPLPPSLETVLAGLEPRLATTVNASLPALSGLPQAAIARLDYRGERLALAAVGDKDPSRHAGLPDESTLFRIGSVSKVFAVLTAIQLYDRGIVKSLDDPLSNYLPSFNMSNRHSKSQRRFTLRQLMSQMSGLPREAPCQMLDCFLSSEEIATRLSQSPGGIWPEYTEPSYSNLAYALLGNALAEFSGMKYESYVQKNILEPLGMMDTGFDFSAEVQSRMAIPYTNEGPTPYFNSSIGFVAPAGQMYSTINDLMKLGRFLLGIEGTLFDDGLRREMLLPAFLYRDGSFVVGFPYETELLTDEKWPMVAKAGNIMGYSAVIAVIPMLNLSFAGLWSGPNEGGDSAAAMFEEVLPSFVAWLRSARPLPHLPANPDAYVGVYQFPSAGLVFNISKLSLPAGEALLISSFVGGINQFNFFLHFYDETSAYLDNFGTDFQASCFVEMAVSFINEWVTFTLGADGTAQSMQVPGNGYWGIDFLRASSDVDQILL